MIKSPLNVPLVIEDALRRNYKDMAVLIESHGAYNVELPEEDQEAMLAAIKQIQINIEKIRKFANGYWNEKKST